MNDSDERSAARRGRLDAPAPRRTAAAAGLPARPDDSAGAAATGQERVILTVALGPLDPALAQQLGAEGDAATGADAAGGTRPGGAGSGGQAGPAVRLVSVALAALDAALLERLAPAAVLAPLLAEGFDILDLAERLAALGYRGRLRALTPPLPRPGMIRAEIRSQCAGLDFDLIELTAR